MNIRSSLTHVRLWAQRRPLITIILVCALTAAAVLIVRWSKPAPTENVFHLIKRGDLLVSVVEGGALKAVNESIIRSEFEGMSRIISIVPEGTYAKKGDLLVELDSSDLRDRVNSQEVTYQNTDFAYIQAKENLRIQKSLVESQVKEAELRVEFARSDLEKYKEGDAPQERKNAESNITIIEEELQRAQDRLDWTRELQKKGYTSKSELEADSLSLKRLRLDLEQAQENLRLLIKYDQPKNIRKLESALDQADKELDRLKQRTTAQISQAEADLRTRERTLELTLEKLNELKKQLQASKIHAPQDGLVVYASSSPFGGGGGNQTLIEEGATVRQRQEIIKLPDVSQMLVEVRVHESHVLQVRPGLIAYVTVDSIPDRQFKGRVRKVAVLPNSQSSWSNPNLKVYSTEVLIEDDLPDLKPGVSARAQIIVTNLSNVLSVPIQAVTTIKGQQVCFVERGNTSVAVPVSIGYFNDQFIEVKSALKEGDRVLLSTPIDTDNIDLSGAIVAAAEAGAALQDQAAKAASTPPAAPNPQPGVSIAQSAPSAPSETPNPDSGPGAPRFARPPTLTSDADPSASSGATNAEARPRGQRRGFGGPGGQGGPDAEKRREEFMKLSPEERAARMRQFQERRGQQGTGSGSGGTPGQGRQRPERQENAQPE